jgi:hypothetical protein
MLGTLQGMAARLFELPGVVADYTVGTAIVFMQIVVRGPRQERAELPRLTSGSR